MALRVGDTVIVRLSGTVSSIDATKIVVTSQGGTNVAFPVAIKDDPGFAYEVMPQATTSYVAGEPYRDADGGLFLRLSSDQVWSRWQVLVHKTLPVGQIVAEDVPVRPLAHLVDETTQLTPPAPAPMVP